MKKLLLLLLLFIGSRAVTAQNLLLRGHINGAKKGDSIEVNVPYDGNYWKKSSTWLKPSANGSFKAALPYRTTKFVQLTYNDCTQYILLSPNRPLQITIDVKKTTQMFNFSGVARPENNLLQKLHLEDDAKLGFVKELKAANSYKTWSIDSVLRIKLPQIKHSLDSTRQLVRNSVLPSQLKSVIATELKYLYACGLANKAGSWLNNRKDRADFNLRFIDSVMANFPLPSKNQLAVSISANGYLDTYLKIKLWKAVYVLRANTDSLKAAEIFKKEMGVAFADLAKDPDRTNEVYLFSTRLKKIAPMYAREKQWVNLMNTFCMQGQLQTADKMLHFIRANNTNPQYLADAERMFAPLKAARDRYASNLNIKIRSDYKQAASVKALLDPYKGKVVLVDMWGTWCPHCIEDMVYEPALKEKLKGKDVVFLYVARDEDADDEKWRDFMLINNLTGEHVRRTSDQIPTLWNELGVPDAEQAYPHYFIFDRSGAMIVKNAKRPGDGDTLYQQLEAALNK